MTIGYALERIMDEYPLAKTQSFIGHPVGNLVRKGFPAEITNALGPLSVGLKVKGSAGQWSTWAAVPWAAVLDRTITETAMKGYYAVYLFHSSKEMVHLSLNQGATATRAEFGQRAPSVLGDRARLMRERLPDFLRQLPAQTIRLGSDAQLPMDYEAGHAMGVSYELGRLPGEDVLQRDLKTVIAAYRALTFRGSLDVSPEIDVNPGGSSAEQLTEARRYAMHQRIERNRRASDKAKKYHGSRCQACDLDFGERYGEIGKGFIEAHHLRPLAALKEGEPVNYDIATDFAVLCANCHRMIHRPSAPSDLANFRKMIRSDES